ncbi:MAG TPA: HAD family hydrolase [Candidatus Omnitrophica bacterium]|nr:HAD family hydrolase [Candidatus Omnitrophota bacterium]
MKKKIRVVSFDVDGTLINQEFNDLIWENEIPSLVAKERGWSFNRAKDFCLFEYDKVGEKDTRWYDIEYWLDKFGIKIPAIDIFKKWEKAIIVYPDVISTLKRTAEKGVRPIVITCMPRIFLKEKIHTFEYFFEKVFSTISDFREVKTPEVYLRIAKIIEVEPSSILHIGDHPVLDYEFSRQADYHSLLIERGMKSNEHSIETLTEIFKFL